MIEVKLLPGGNHTTQDGVLHKVGETFEVTEEEAAVWADRFQVVKSKPVELKTGQVTAKSPVSEIDGIGPSTAKKLAAVGVKTIGDLATANTRALASTTGLTADQLDEWAEEAKAIA